MGMMDEPALYDHAGEVSAARSEAERDYIAACAEADMRDPSYVADLFGDWNDALQDKLTKMMMALQKDDEDDALGYAYDALGELEKLARNRVKERMARAA